MADNTHTQGPWTVSKPSGNYIEAPTGGIAALTYGASKADAHLIAAAPDLLEALRQILEDAEIDCDTEAAALAALAEIRVTARAAIAKAKGAA